MKSAGGKTPLAPLFSAGLLVIVLLWIADFFQPLPKVSKIIILTQQT
jgi:MFS superfamily sulfate permease-like transporter